MSLEKVEKGSYRGSSVPKISIRQSGSIGISKAVVEDHFSDATGVVLYYDDEENRIGLEPADKDEDPDAYTLALNNGSGSVAAKSMLTRFDLVPEETTAYEPDWNDDHGMILIDLDNPL